MITWVPRWMRAPNPAMDSQRSCGAGRQPKGCRRYDYATQVSKSRSRSLLAPRIIEKLVREYSVTPNVSSFAPICGLGGIDGRVTSRTSIINHRSEQSAGGRCSDMDDKDACSSSSKATERLASIAGAFLSDNMTTLSKPFHKVFGGKKGSLRQAPALPPLRHSLADAAALPSYVDLQSRLRSSVAREEHQRLLKHRLKPQVTFISSVPHSSQLLHVLPGCLKASISCANVTRRSDAGPRKQR